MNFRGDYNGRADSPLCPVRPLLAVRGQRSHPRGQGQDRHRHTKHRHRLTEQRRPRPQVWSLNKKPASALWVFFPDFFLFLDFCLLQATETNELQRGALSFSKQPSGKVC